MTDDATRQSFCLMLAYLCITPGSEREKFLAACEVKEARKEMETMTRQENQQ